MRILTLTNLYPNPIQPNRGIFNGHQVRALAQTHELAVVAPIAWTDALRFRHAGRPVPLRRQEEDLPHVHVAHPRYLYPPRTGRRLYGRCYLASVRRIVHQVAAQLRPDVIFSPWAYPDGWAAVRLGKELGIPSVVKVHGSDLRLLDAHPARRGGTIQALTAADRIVAVSRDLAELAIALGADRQHTSVVYDGVDTARFSPGCRRAARRRLGLPLDQQVVLYVGNLLPVKGPDVLLEAVRLAAPRANFRCHLIGEGPLRNAIEEAIADDAWIPNLRGRIVLHGAKAHHELPDWFRAADAVVLPSRSEGVPCVLLEAAAVAAGVVIATRVGGVPEVAHLARSELVPPESPRELANAMVEALTDPTRFAAPTTRFARSHADAADELTAVFASACGRRLEESHEPEVESHMGESRARHSLAVAPPAVLVDAPRRAGCAGCPRRDTCRGSGKGPSE